MKKMGFEKEIELVEQVKCPFCLKKIDPNNFRNSKSKKKFEINGLCQDCQDNIFGNIWNV